MLILSLAYLGVFFVSVSNVLDQQAEDSNRSAINGFQEEINNYADQIDFISRVIANDEKLQNGLNNNSDILVTNAIQPHLYNTEAPIVAVFNSYGELMMSSVDYLSYVDTSYTAPIVDSLSGDFSAQIVEGLYGNYTIIQTTPVRNDLQKVVGVLYVGYLLNDDSFLNEMSVKYSTEYISLNESNVLSTSIDGIELNVDVKLALTEDNEVANSIFKVENVGKTISSDVKVEGKTYTTLYKTIGVDHGNPFVLASMVDKNIYADTMSEIAILSLSVGLGIMLIVIIFLYLYFRSRVNKPLSQITEAANKIKNGNTNIKIDIINSKDEFELLTRTFSELIEDNKNKSLAISKIASGEVDKLSIDDKNGEDELAININRLSKTIQSLSISAESASFAVLMGSLDYQLDTEHSEGKYKEILSGINNIISSFDSHLSKMPISIFTVDYDKQVHFANEHSSKYSKDFIGKSADDIFNFNYEDLDYLEDTLQLGNSHNVHVTAVPERIEDTAYLQLITTPLQTEDGMIVGALVIAIDETEVKRIENRLQKQSDYQTQKIDQLIINISKLSQGDFNMEFTPIESDEDTEEVKSTFEIIEKTLVYSISLINTYVQTITSSLEKLAKGNLDVEIDIDFVGDFASIKDSLKDIIISMNDLAFSIRQSANNVMIGANNQTKDAEELSNGTTAQASAIEEISATVTEVSAQVVESSKQIEEVTEYAKLNRENALMSDHRMRKLEDSMDDINKATEQIQSVLKLINDIAFQTNILSLNAAVEAARAGVHGKGFAVIAEDVRNLALKSSDAANETEEMIKKVLDHVQEGMKNAKDTAQSMKEIFNGAKKVNKLAKAIKLNSAEQTTAIGQIDVSLDQISKVVQEAQMSAKTSLEQSRILLVDAEEMVDTSNHFELRQDYKTKLVSQNLVQSGREVDSFSKDELINTVDTNDEEIVINLDADDF
jgi:methyl-accepting chemotaxis protein